MGPSPKRDPLKVEKIKKMETKRNLPVKSQRVKTKKSPPVRSQKVTNQKVTNQPRVTNQKVTNQPKKMLQPWKPLPSPKRDPVKVEKTKRKVTTKRSHLERNQRVMIKKSHPVKSQKVTSQKVISQPRVRSQLKTVKPQLTKLTHQLPKLSLNSEEEDTTEPIIN